MTVGVVCAQDANQTVPDTLELDDTQKVISDTPELSYDDLSKKINESSDSITLESDYKYKDTDSIKHIEFTNRNFTIDGNNHAIDADGKTNIFKMNGGKLTLKNLVLKNTNDSAILLRNGILNTINVTFINTTSPNTEVQYMPTIVYITVTTINLLTVPLKMRDQHYSHHLLQCI